MLESLKRNKKGIILMLISALSLSVGQLLWKFADFSDIGTKISSFEGIVKLVLSVAPGFIVYALGALVMTIALGSGELSVLQPINSMSYVFALILSAIFLTEPITPLMVIGIFVIIVGVILIGGSSKNE
ncbi:MAG: EamA/RhaT family transporter [Lachnospiraceae bacterium]|nr:EamA/RhaT family transporter [Lachnospiraceae bacterium]